PAVGAYRAGPGAGGRYRHDSGAVRRTGGRLLWRGLATVAARGALWQPLRHVLVDARVGDAGGARPDRAGDTTRPVIWSPAAGEHGRGNRQRCGCHQRLGTRGADDAAENTAVAWTAG